MPTQATHLPTLLRSATHPILLRTLEPRDAASVSAVLSDPENTKHDPHASALSPEVAARVIERMRESASVPTVLDPASGRVASGPGRVNLLIVHVPGVDNTLASTADDGVVIGFGGFGDIKDLEEDGKKIRVGDVGAMINAEYRGKGFATEAIRLAVEWAFTSVEDGGPQLDRVSATMSEKNEPMIGLVEKKLGWKGVVKPGKEEGGGEMYFEVTKDAWRK
ncbi:GCN5-related N-acetyltransferase protein [Colletotrichum plurivorum]|uniref:GCN5-related N-acetyltransferase protein n=1 Tax=Colletotrichum plurivorum TaxID=2175906 RepID=A0A8H6KDF8_9PEZI|nr:GCN5-related N-acetyltransferase protein [Colletotrichum plurivorum]